MVTTPGVRRAAAQPQGEMGAGGWLGILLIAASGVSFSSAGLFTRLIPADTWTVLFWRSAVGGLCIGGYIVWRRRGATSGAFRAIGLAGLLAASCSTLGTICFVHALRRTTVADVTIINATAPFLAAAFTWLWLGERARRVTLAASLLALLGVALMVGPALTSGQLSGDLLALAMTALIALMMVIIRRNKQVSMLPASCLSAFACTLIVAPLAHPAGVSGLAFFWLLLFGVQFGLGLLLLTLGSRLLPASRAALLGNLELPLAPLWVWLAFGELPPPATWIGGAVVVIAVLLDMIAGRHRAPAAARPSSGSIVGTRIRFALSRGPPD